MPRANRRRRDDVPLAAARLQPTTTTESYAGHDWLVRRLSGASSTRGYLCPGCSQEVAPGTPHVVVWPAEGVGGVGDRRHWHTPCWSARNRRHTRAPIR